MRKLLSANLSRLWMNSAFWITVLVMIGVELLFSIMLRQDSLPMDAIFFLALQGIGLLSSVFFSLFLGTEYSDGTIRNKLIVGHKRTNIYLASFITGLIAVTIIFFAGILTGILVGILLYSAPYYSVYQIVLACFVGWLASVSYISIFNLAGMLSSSKAKTSIICLLAAFGLLFAGMLCYSLLSYSQDAILQFLFEFNPLGQTIQALSIGMSSPLKFIAYALVLSVSLNGIGLYFFSKKDFK